MPSCKYEFIVNGKVDYTCYSQRSVKDYAFIMDMEGIGYKVKKTSLI